MDQIFDKKTKYGPVPSIDISYQSSLAKDFLYAMQSGILTLTMPLKEQIERAYALADAFIEHSLKIGAVKPIPEPEKTESETV